MAFNLRQNSTFELYKDEYSDGLDQKRLYNRPTKQCVWNRLDGTVVFVRKYQNVLHFLELMLNLVMTSCYLMNYSMEHPFFWLNWLRQYIMSNSERWPMMFDELLPILNELEITLNWRIFVSLRSAHTRGQVPATSPCNKLRGQVPSCELAISATKSSRRD